MAKAKKENNRAPRIIFNIAPGRDKLIAKAAKTQHSTVAAFIRQTLDERLLQMGLYKLPKKAGRPRKA